MSLRRIILDQRIVADDCQHLADDATLPPAGPFTVSLDRWRKEHGCLQARMADAGVRLPNDLDVSEVFSEISAAARIVVEFPKFGDGRAMSQAHLLRERHHFKAEIRVTGDVLRDQIWYMHRCGINAFELRPGSSLEDALKAFSEMSLSYQAATDTQQSIFQRRRGTG